MATAVDEKANARVQKVATKAIDVQAKINALNAVLDTLKDELRVIADGSTKTIVVAEKGKVHIAKASEKTTVIVLAVDEERLDENPTLKQKLLDKKIITQKTKTTGGGCPAVTIKPNV